MSLVTRCPACATAFKVVRDQLRISEGWVRCGRCSHVFDATLDLQMEEGSAPATDQAVPAPEAAPASSDAVDVGSPQIERSVDAADDDVPEPVPAVDRRPPPDGDKLNEPQQASLDTASEDFEPTTTLSAPLPLELPELPDLAAAPASIAAPVSVSSGPVTHEAFHERTAHVFSVTRGAPTPVAVPAVVADEPRSVQAVDGRIAERRPNGGPMVAPSPVDEAVDAQLQKALRRARIQAVREGRFREGAARVNSPLSRGKDARDERMNAPARPQPRKVAEESVLELNLRQASQEAAIQEPVASAAAVTTPSFLEAAAPVKVPRRSLPGSRAMLALAVLVAVFVMALQILRHERDVLVAAQPGLRPALNALCKVSGCELSALRRIDSVRIDGSSFTPERAGGGAYRLLFSLRNASATAVAMPAIELSLLDGNERTVVRRVFRPAEFGAPAALTSRAEHTTILSLSLRAADGGGMPPVVGYRMLAFYP